MCLVGLFLTVSVFADNLPTVATLLLASSNWSAVATLPVLVVAYVIGLLAIALVDRGTRPTNSGISALSQRAVAMRYGQLEQEAEILSGSVVGFALLGVAALTFVHRRLWPALVKLASRFRKEPLAKTSNEHTPSGAHRSRRMVFPRWVPGDVMKEAERLSVADAERILLPWLSLGRKRARHGG